MKTFICEGKEVTIPDISHVQNDDGSLMFEIQEGDHKGIIFALDNMRIDENDESLMWYDLKTEKEEQVLQIKETVDNFILSILHEQIQRSKDENQTSV